MFEKILIVAFLVVAVGNHLLFGDTLEAIYYLLLAILFALLRIIELHESTEKGDGVNIHPKQGRR